MPDNSNTPQLTFTQAAFTVTALQIGTGIAILPRQLANAAGHDSWISVLLGGLVFILLAAVLIMLAGRFPQKTIFEYLPEVMGKPLGYLLTCFLIVFFLLPVVIGTRTYVDAVQLWSLPRTPRWLLSVLIMLPGVYLARSGIQAIARLAELYIFMLALFSLMIILPVGEINWGVFLPVGDAGLTSVLQGVLVTSYSFGGIFILLLIYPEIRHKARAASAAVLGVTITMLVYLILTVMAIGLFSRAALQEDIFPVQNLISLTKLELIQRIDVIFLYLTLTTVVTTQAPVLYISAVGLQSLTGCSYKKFVPWLGIIPFLLLSYPLDMFEFAKLSDYASYSWLAVESVLPAVVLITAVIRGRRPH